MYVKYIPVISHIYLGYMRVMAVAADIMRTRAGKTFECNVKCCGGLCPGESEILTCVARVWLSSK